MKHLEAKLRGIFAKFSEALLPSLPSHKKTFRRALHFGASNREPTTLILTLISLARFRGRATPNRNLLYIYCLWNLLLDSWRQMV